MLPSASQSSVPEKKEVNNSYARVTQRNQFPKLDQAVILDCIEGLNLTDYTCAVGDLVEPKNVLYSSRISNNRIRIFLANKELVNSLTEKHKFLIIKEEKVTIRPLILKQHRIILSNVCPSIPHFVLEEMLDGLNIKRSSSITSLRATVTNEKYSHVLSERRQVYINPDDVSKLPEILKVRYEDSVYFVFPSTDAIRCFVCKQEGHIAKLCPNQNENSPNYISSHYDTSKDNTRKNFPELVTTTPLNESDKITEIRNNSENVDSTQTTEPPNNVSMEIVTNAFKRPLSTSSASTTQLENMRVLSGSESSLESLAAEPYTNVTDNANQSKKTKQKQKKIKRSFTPCKNQDLDDILKNIKEKIESPDCSYPLNYIKFKSFLDKAFSSPDTVEIANEYSSSIAEISNMMRDLYNDIPNKGIKSRFTKIIKKIELALPQTTPPNSNI